ncbi:MAG: hypothetical protein ACYCTV_07025 [Leptospirales bacterium]
MSKNEKRQKNDGLSDNTIGIDSQSGERGDEIFQNQRRINTIGSDPLSRADEWVADYTAYQSAVSLSLGKGADDLEERVHRQSQPMI